MSYVRSRLYTGFNKDNQGQSAIGEFVYKKEEGKEITRQVLDKVVANPVKGIEILKKLGFKFTRKEQKNITAMSIVSSNPWYSQISRVLKKTNYGIERIAIPKIGNGGITKKDRELLTNKFYEEVAADEATEE